MKIAVKDLTNKEVGSIELEKSIFGADIRPDIMHQMVHYQLNKRRAGTHKVKDKGEVNGTGAKPWNQKGTGRARAGDLKRPQDTGGGIVFGPVPRSHATALPKKIRKAALRSALSTKAKEGKLVILEDIKAKDHKTKPMAKAFEKFGFESALIIGGKEIDANFARATSNLPKIDVLPSQGVNVYDILRRDMLVLTKDAVNEITEKLKD
jgi:large subunit ribosomal protein L4